MAVTDELLRNPNTRIIDGELCVYCEEDGNYYPKFMESKDGYRMELDEKYFIYVAEGDTVDLSNERNREYETYMLSLWYGEARKKYLYEHFFTVFADLDRNNKLRSYLIELDKQAVQMEADIMAAHMKAEGLTEAYKAEHPIEWANRSNAIRYAARDEVQETLIFVPPMGYTEEDMDDYEKDE